VRDSTLARASSLPDSGRAVARSGIHISRHCGTAVVADLGKGAIDAGRDECVEEKGMLSLEGGIVEFRHELARRALRSANCRRHGGSLAPGKVVPCCGGRPMRARVRLPTTRAAADVAALLKFRGALEKKMRGPARREKAQPHF